MSGMADARLRPQFLGALATILLAIAALGLAFHALTDAVCSQPENVGFRSCASSPTASVPAGGPSATCGAIHSGCMLPEIANFAVPFALIFTTSLVVAQLTPLHFSPPAQPPKYFQTL